MFELITIAMSCSPHYQPSLTGFHKFFAICNPENFQTGKTSLSRLSTRDGNALEKNSNFF
jgi:hypothetical protein